MQPLSVVSFPGYITSKESATPITSFLALAVPTNTENLGSSAGDFERTGVAKSRQGFLYSAPALLLSDTNRSAVGHVGSYGTRNIV